MAMGKRKPRQESLFIATDQLAQSPGHPFYQRLNALLAEAEFDRWVEQRCREYYEQDEPRGRKSIPPGVYFRMILIGYFESLPSQRGIAWRCSDSRSLAEFLGFAVDERTPDHSSLSRIHGRLPLEIHQAVFVFVLKLAAEHHLLAGKTVAVDSTTLEADAAKAARLPIAAVFDLGQGPCVWVVDPATATLSAARIALAGYDSDWAFIGAGVWLQFEGGDADYPVWTGGWWGNAAEVPVLALAGVPGDPNIVLQTALQNTVVVSDLPGPTGGIMLKSTTGATIIVNDTGIYIQNGKGASIVMVGPSVTINAGALVVV